MVVGNVCAGESIVITFQPVHVEKTNVMAL